MFIDPEPTHAAKLYEEAELRAERLVAILRIVIAVGLGAMFLVTVVGSSEPPQPVLARQWVFAASTMAAYFTLGVLSLWLVSTGLYRPWMAWLAASGDCAFLLVNVWLSLRNTGFPGDYLISYPPVWLAPLVLAFGALRFNPRLQAYLIAVLVAGLVTLALMNQPGTVRPPLPPADLLQTFFSPPPNLMRLSMFVLAGVVLVIASLRTRQLLARAINETRRRLNLTLFLPEQIVDRLADADIDELRFGDRRELVIMFVDIRNFTEQSQTMEPDTLSRFVTEFRRRVGLAVQAHGGMIDKFIGDAALVVFGLAENRKPASGAALACAGTLLEQLSEWSEDRVKAGARPVSAGIGIHLGEVFCGVIGEASRLEFTVLGDTVNVAERLQELTKEVGHPVVVSRDVLSAAAIDEAHYHSLGAVVLRGRRQSIDVYGYGAFGLHA